MTTVTDPVAGAAYTTFRKAKVARTVEVSVSVMIDVDADGRIIGVETLDGSDWRDALANLAMRGRLAIPREVTDGCA